MRLFLSIAICSIVLASSVHAQSIVNGFAGASWSGTYPAVVWFRDNMPGGTFQVRGPGGLYYEGPGGSGDQYVVENQSAYNALLAVAPGRPVLAWRLITGATNVINPSTGIAWGQWQGDTNYFPPVAQATNSFEFYFGPEWSGVTLQVRATNGQTLGTWGLPGQIGPGGYTLAASIATNASLLTGAQVFLDGQSVASLASSSSNSNWSAYRPGYDIEFDGSYKDGDWRIQRSDGTIALSGSVATLNDAINGRFTVTGTNTATIWTRVPGGDGNGGTWVPSPVTFGQNNTTVSYFFSGATNPTNVPVPTPPPTPIPTPGPVATPAPATTNVTTNTVQPDELVNVNVPDAAELDGEFGAAEVVEEARGAFGKVAEGYENFAEAFTNAALTFNEFKQIYLPPPGNNCTFEFGPVSVNLSNLIPAWVRGASKLVFLFAALAAMKRMLWEAFS